MRKLFVLVGVAFTAVLALSSSAAAQSTACNGTLTGQTVAGDLVVPDNGSCTLVNSTVGDDVWVGKNAYFQATGSQIADHVESNRSLTLFIDTGTTAGDVEANRTEQVFIFNSTINGRVEAWRSTAQVQICGNTIDGKVHVHNSARDILFGDPSAVDCAANTILNGHDASIEDNFTDVELVVRGNVFQGGDLRVNDNEGPSEKFVQDNTGGDQLDCFGNDQPFTASGNTGWSDLRGQCAIPPTECNGTLTGQTIPGDLVVPDDGSCTLVGGSVGDDVKVGRNAYFQATGTQIGDDVRAYGALTVFIDTGTTVGGDVKTHRTAQVFAFNSTLNGRLDVSRSTDQVHVCGNTIDGSVRISDSGRDILFGDPSAVDCAANQVLNGHSATIEDNFTDVELVVRGNTFQGGDLRVNGNEGPSEKFVQNNVGGDDLECFGNEQPFTASGNTGWNDQRGQCAIPPTECNGALSGQTIPGDLVVPEDGTCTITGSSVGGDVKVGRNAYFQATGSQIADDVYANRALTVFIDTGTTVGDDIHAFRTSEVFVFNATVADRLEVSGSDAAVQICGSTLNGRTSVTDSGRDILIGDPLAVDCAGNTITNGHSLTVSDNFADVEFVVRGNTFQGGDLRVNDNEGPVEKFVQDNTGGDDLECFGNEDVFTATGNTFADEDGQCAEI
jgi:cyclophilin family peptidyl-prolyl cis-trans isomerase